MKILFLTLVGIDDINQRGIYPDLLRCLVDNGHHVTVVSPIERRSGKGSYQIKNKDNHIIRVKTLNIQKANFIEKALGTLWIDFQFRNAIKRKLASKEFDLLLYSTPPITLTNSIAFAKEKYNCATYLMLKDIFPQNAVDLDMMKKGSIIFNYFRSKEKRLYELTDTIGCMSQANVDFILRHNELSKETNVEICPNSIKPTEQLLNKEDKIKKRKEHNVPIDKRVFIYGGNLGKPQGMDFILQFLSSQLDNKKAYFIIMGSGTALPDLEKWVDENKPDNVLVTGQLPKKKYDDFQKIGDIGLIFLDERFTIPNYPSRLLTYIDDSMPVIAAVDRNTDIGSVIEENNFGRFSISGDLKKLNENVSYFCEIDEEKLEEFGKNGRNYLLGNYTAEHSYQIIMNSVAKNERVNYSKNN